jgi:WD40 repeat protein
MLILNGEAEARSLAFTADGTHLVATRDDGQVDVWRLPGGERIHSIAPGGSFDNKVVVVLHPSKPFMFIGGAHILVVSLDGESITIASETPVAQVIASPDGAWVIAVGADGDGQRLLVGFSCAQERGLVQAWDVQPHVGGETLGGFIGSGDSFVTINRGQVVVRKRATGEVVSTVQYPSSYVCHAATSPDGSQFAVQGYSQLYVWDAVKWGKPKRIESVGGRRFTSFAFHPTKPLFAAIQTGQTLVKFFDTANWKLSARFAWKLGEMVAVTFSPDGTLAAASSKGGKIVVWDVDA